MSFPGKDRQRKGRVENTCHGCLEIRMQIGHVVHNEEELERDKKMVMKKGSVGNEFVKKVILLHNRRSWKLDGTARVDSCG